MEGIINQYLVSVALTTHSNTFYCIQIIQASTNHSYHRSLVPCTNDPTIRNYLLESWDQILAIQVFFITLGVKKTVPAKSKFYDVP